MLIETLRRRNQSGLDNNEKTRTLRRMLERKKSVKNTFFRGGIAVSICNSALIMLVEKNKDNFTTNIIGAGVFLLIL